MGSPSACGSLWELELDMRKRQNDRPPFEGEHAVDSGIQHAVRVLWENGVETFSSCEGGPGHSFQRPTVRFYGEQSEGFRALGIALQHGLDVLELRRFWLVYQGEASGPYWELNFRAPAVPE